MKALYRLSDPARLVECQTCKIAQPAKDFSGAWKGAKCKTCTAVYVKEAYYLREVGITLEEAEAMVSSRNGKCDLCGGSDRRGLCVDHDHLTKEPRGVLCHPCNTAMGQLGDSIEGLQRALNYLKKG